MIGAKGSSLFYKWLTIQNIYYKLQETLLKRIFQQLKNNDVFKIMDYGLFKITSVLKSTNNQFPVTQ